MEKLATGGSHIMGLVQNFPSEKLIIGMLSSRPQLTERVIDRLSGCFGKPDYISPVLNFTFTDYYNDEMDGLITRLFLSFESLVDPETLADIKLLTNDIESEYAEAGNRRVNLDPGLLSLSRLILATTKDNAHRIPLSKGIYGELTLLFRKKGFLPLEWTYPDFRSEEYNAILVTIRTIFREQLNQHPEYRRY